MKPAKFLAALCVSALAATSAEAAAPQQLYSLERVALDKAARTQASRLVAPDAIEEFLIQVDPAAVAANPPVFALDLPDYPALEAVRTRFVTYRPDWKSWIGTVRHAGTTGRGTGYIHLGFHGNQLSALIDFEGERFQIVGNLREGHSLVRLSDDLSPLSCGTESPAGAAEALTGGEEGAGTPPRTFLDKATHRIDVLALYPRDFFPRSASEENSLFTFVQDSISLANDAFVKSGVDASYNLVGIVPLTGNQPPLNGQFGDLAWMTGGNGVPVAAEVAALRNAFGADVVALFTPFDRRDPAPNRDFCGAANEPLANNRFFRGNVILNEAMGDRAFNVSRNNCGKLDFTLGHEIGHNYGMRHDVEDHGTDNLFAYAQGFTFTDPTDGIAKATVMGCSCSGCFCYPINDPRHCVLGAGAVCNRIPYFSDPTKVYNTVTIGDATHDNARVGRERVATYAGFRAQSANTPPTANFTVSCTGRTCSFNATSSTDNTGISSYWWDFGDNTTGSGATPSHPYNSSYTTGTTLRVHLVVTDTGGQTDVHAGTATIQPTYEGYLENANCRTINGWAWDQNNPNNPINVDIYRDLTKVSTVPANAFRQDLLNAGKGNGVHGFGYTPNGAWKDGVWHAARVRFPGTTTNLTWSPINIICGVSALTSQTPTENLDTAGVVYTVGNQFSSTHSGYITHLRFYRAPGESGTNTGKLWSNSGGSPLATVTFPGSPASGWVEAALSPAVAITAGTLYRATVNTNVRQSKTGCGLSPAITNQVLTAHQGFWIAGSGVFPTNGSCGNFFVDVKFDL